MKKQSNIPQLRFPEYKEEWAFLPLGAISKEIKRVLSNKEDVSDLEVLTISSENGWMSQKERFSQVIAGQSLEKYTILQKGEMAYNRGASKRFKYGCFYALKTYEKALVPNVYISFVFNESCDYDFYNQLFSTGYANKQLRQFISSSVRLDGLLNINRANFFSIKIPLPSLNEQKHIASFFSVLDKRITQLKQKKRLLEQYKKGVMQKLFSQELRFKDENGKEFPEWEKNKLGEISRITTGSSNREDSNLDGEYTFFDRSQDIRSSNRFLFDAEAIIVPGEGKEFIPKYFIGKFDLHQRSYAIMDFKNQNGKFLYFSISFNSNHLNSHAVGSTVKSLRLPMFEKMPINLPCLAEQTQTANFLSAIDKKINFTQTQLEKTELYKKGLLQKMFV